MRKKLWLCMPFAVLAAVDFGLTLSGQSPAYWQGEHSEVNEIFPLFALGLRCGPLTFLFICLLWVLVFSTLIVVFPDIASQVLSLALVIGHTWGAMSWLVYRFRVEYHLCVLLFLLPAVLFISAQAKWRKTKTAAHTVERTMPAASHPPTGIR
jgi:hypothetical protein